MEVTLYPPVHLQTGLKNTFTFLLFTCTAEHSSTAEHSANEALLLHATVLLRLYVWTLYAELECDPENVPIFGGSSSKFDQKYAACTNGMKTKAMNSGLETSMIPRGGNSFSFVVKMIPITPRSRI
jgi:hypothetical protein